MNFATLPQSEKLFRTYWAWIDGFTKPIPVNPSTNTLARIERRVSDLHRQFVTEATKMAAGK